VTEHSTWNITLLCAAQTAEFGAVYTLVILRYFFILLHGARSRSP